MPNLIARCFLMLLMLSLTIPVLADELTLAPQTLRQSFRFKGRLMPARLISITAPVGGTIQSMPVRFGQPVQPGQLLFELNNAELPKEYQEAKQRVQQAEAQLKELRQWNYQLEAQQLDYQIARAKTDLERLKIRFEQTQKLFQAGVISKEEALQEERAIEESQHHLKHLQLMYDKLKQSSEGKLYQEALQTLALAKTNLQTAQSHIQGLILKSPGSGILLPSSESKGNDSPITSLIGQTVNAGDVLGYLASVDQFVVEVMVDETEMQSLTESQSVEIQLPALPGASVTGKISQIYKNQLKANHQAFVQYPVIIEIDPFSADLSKQVWFGMSATVNLKIEQPDTLVIPKQAIHLDTQGAWVMCKKGKETVPTHVVLGKITWDEAEIVQGLKAGDILVTPYPTTRS